MLQHLQQLVDGVRPERVEHVGPVEGDPDRAVRDRPVVGQVGQVLEPGDRTPGVGVEDLGHTLDGTHGEQAIQPPRAARRTVGAMTLSGEYEPSPEQWVRDQVERYEATGGREANILRGRPEWPIVVITSRGAKSGKLRKNPVMRVEKDGVYAAVASQGRRSRSTRPGTTTSSRTPRSTSRTGPSRTRTSPGSPRARSGPSGGSAAWPSSRRTPSTRRRPTGRSRSSCSNAPEPALGGSGVAGDGRGERDEVTEPGQLGVEHLGSAAAAEHDHLVVGQRGRREDVVLVGGVQALGPGDRLPGQDSGAAEVACRISAPPSPLRRIRAPQSARNVSGSTSTSRSRACCGCPVSSSTASRSRNRLPPAAYRRDPDDADAVELVAGRHDRVRHRAGGGLQEHVVDRGPVGTVLDDLDRLDVAAGLTDRRRDATEGPGDVGQLDAQEERHASTIVPR